MYAVWVSIGVIVIQKWTGPLESTELLTDGKLP